MWNQKPSFRFEIDNFSKKEAAVASKTFVSGGCKWYLYVHPKGARLAENHLSLYLSVANPNSLRNGWQRSADFYFVVLNQSEKVLYRSSPIGQAANSLFCANNKSWGFRKTLPLSKFQEKGVLEKDKLIIEVYIKVIEAVDAESRDVTEKKKKKTVDINGFQVFASQVTSVREIFAEHPDIAEDFKSKNQAVKTVYMNALLNLIKKLQKPPKSLSETKLRKAWSDLSELMDVGFKLDWLKLNLEEVCLEKKVNDDSFKLDWLKTNLEEVSMERKESDYADGSRVQKLEERVKNLELMELGFKLDSLKTKLDEVSLERKKSDDDNESWAQQLEERVKNIELVELRFKLEC